jgi:hypothetical protein
MGEDVLAREEKLDMLVQERTRALGDRTEQLEILSIKLSKYLPPQVYASIFQGRQKVEITSNRKKLTVFFPTSWDLPTRRKIWNPRSSPEFSTDISTTWRQSPSNMEPRSTNTSATQS